jgi:general secretion pathway protein D
MALVVALMSSTSLAQAERHSAGEEMVNLDFEDAEITVLIKTISELTGKNFIYDERASASMRLLP